MPTVEGFVRSVNHTNKILASFFKDDILYNFAGTVETNMHPHFEYCTATLDYSSLSDLAALRTFSGTMGLQTVNFTLSNGVKIIGPPDEPDDTPSEVSGSGSWSQV